MISNSSRICIHNMITIYIFIQIAIYTTLSITVHDPFSVNESASMRQLIRCHQKFHGSPRYDWIAVYDLADKNFGQRQGIDRYLFGQARLLFELQQNEDIYHLAYLEWYDITDVPSIEAQADSDGSLRRTQKMVPRDPETNMAVAIRSGEFNVVSVNAIIRSVHMQPLFMERDSARQALMNNRDAYSFDSYFVNKFADRGSWEELF